MPRHPPCALTILTVIRPADKAGPGDTRYFKFGQLCGFQGPARSATAGDSGGWSLKTQQRVCFTRDEWSEAVCLARSSERIGVRPDPVDMLGRPARQKPRPALP